MSRSEIHSTFGNIPANQSLTVLTCYVNELRIYLVAATVDIQTAPSPQLDRKMRLVPPIRAMIKKRELMLKRTLALIAIIVLALGSSLGAGTANAGNGDPINPGSA